jgi:hypothetical protein
MRIVELSGGIGVFVLGSWMWLLTAADEPFDLMVFLVLVGPGTVVAVGSSLQTLFHKRWALALVLLGVVATLFVGIKVFFLFRYFGNTVWVRSVSADISLVMITLITSVVLAFADAPKILSSDGVEQIVGPERRERVC